MQCCNARHAERLGVVKELSLTTPRTPACMQARDMASNIRHWKHYRLGTHTQQLVSALDNRCMPPALHLFECLSADPAHLRELAAISQTGAIAYTA
jgi:hypothetical protein